MNQKPIEFVLERMKERGLNPKPNGKGWRFDSASQLFHPTNRSNRSGYLEEGDDGRVLITDFADPQGTKAVEENLQHLELSWRDLRPAEGVPPAREHMDRHVIQVNNKQDRILILECWRVLAAWNDPVNPLLLRNSEGQLCTWENERLRPVTEKRLHSILSRMAVFTKRLKDRQEVDAQAPRYIFGVMLAEPPDDIPLVKEVVSVPTFTGLESFRDYPGYEACEQVLCIGESLGVEVASKPTQQDVSDALSILVDDWLCDFRFARDSDRANALGFALTLMARRMIDGLVPAFLIDSAQVGSGKTLLAQVLCAATKGAAPPMTSLPKQGDELKKKLFAAARGGSQVLFFDNISAVTGELGEAIAGPLTSGEVEDRVLGESRVERAQLRAVTIFTGNNVSLSPEMVRRTVRVRLDVPNAEPWNRTDWRHTDLLEWTLEQRPMLTWALATLIANWLAQEKPDGSAGRASYGAWARSIGGVLECAGVEGFLAREDLAEMMAFSDSPEEIQDVVAFWREDFGEDEVSASILANRMFLKRDFNAILGDGGKRSRAIRLGRFLARHRGLVIEGLQIACRANTAAHSRLWRLEPVSRDVAGCHRDVKSAISRLKKAWKKVRFEVLTGMSGCVSEPQSARKKNQVRRR